MATDVLPEEADLLRDWIAGQRVGAESVLSAQAELGLDASGGTAIFFDVLLSGPSADSETWPIDEVLNFHQRIDARATELGLRTAWHVRLIPERTEDLESEGLDE